MGLLRSKPVVMSPLGLLMSHVEGPNQPIWKTTRRRARSGEKTAGPGLVARRRRLCAVFSISLATSLAAGSVAHAQSSTVPTVQECADVCSRANSQTLTPEEKKKLIACVLNKRCVESGQSKSVTPNPFIGPYK
jgi:hypothetical protein